MCDAQVSYWVASEICCVEDARIRELLIEKFIDVAKVSEEKNKLLLVYRYRYMTY